MNNKIKNTLQFVLFMGFGALLFWLVFRNTDFELVFEKLKNINYVWFIPAVFAFILSHISRAMRWQMLINPLGYKSRFWNTFWAVLVMYFVNLGIPRGGEIARCGVVAKYDKINVTKLIGTMITERVFDLFVLITLSVVVFFLSSSDLMGFLDSNPELKTNISKVLSTNVLIIIGLVIVSGIIALYLLFKGKLDHIKFFKKIHDFFRNLLEGLLSFKDVKNKPLFIFHSLFIFLMYFVTFYVTFKAFDFFENITLQMALFAFVMSSYGMVAPAPNGIGAFHFMIIQTLLIFGISEVNGEVFALVSHSLQTIFIIIAGIAAFIALPIINRNTSSKDAK